MENEIKDISNELSNANEDCSYYREKYDEM